MKWILIVVATFVDGGIDVEIARFKTQAACEEAAAFVREEQRKGWREVRTKCMLEAL